MPTIKLRLTDKQFEEMQEHFSKGASIEAKEETVHGVALHVHGFWGLWLMEAESQAGKIDLDYIDVEFDSNEADG